MLLALSLTHASAGFDALEHATAAVAGLSSEELLRSAMAPDQVSGAVVLSTCNRLEAYLDLTPDASTEAADHIIGSLAQRAAQPQLHAGVVTHRDEAALRHLFSVTAGLDSLVVGEEEITGQVARAYDGARRVGTTTPVLDTAFQRALRTSRLVRSRASADPETSVAHLALDLASARLVDWREARVLLVGTGAHARTTARALHRHGAHNVGVFSAAGRAEYFAQRHGFSAVPAGEDLAAAIAEADLVIACTSRSAIGRADVSDRSAKPLLVVDLGLPRNVDPTVGQVPGVEVLDLAAIAHHVDLPGLGRRSSGEDAVTSAVEQYASDDEAAPAIVALRQHVGEVMGAEIARARDRARDEEEAARVEAALRHFVGVLLHTPSVRAHQAAASGTLTEYVSGLNSVFGIGPDLRSSSHE